jgi:hypothetical protein
VHPSRQSMTAKGSDAACPQAVTPCPGPQCQCAQLPALARRAAHSASLFKNRPASSACYISFTTSPQSSPPHHQSVWLPQRPSAIPRKRPAPLRCTARPLLSPLSLFPTSPLFLSDSPLSYAHSDRCRWRRFWSARALVYSRPRYPRCISLRLQFSILLFFSFRSPAERVSISRAVGVSAASSSRLAFLSLLETLSLPRPQPRRCLSSTARSGRVPRASRVTV